MANTAAKSRTAVKKGITEVINACIAAAKIYDSIVQANTSPNHQPARCRNKAQAAPNQTNARLGDNELATAKYCPPTVYTVSSAMLNGGA